MLAPHKSSVPTEPDIGAFLYVAASGEQERGAPGVVWVDAANGHCVYLLLSEVKPEALQAGVKTMLEEDAGECYFVIHKHETDVHVFKHPKRDAEREIRKSAFAEGMRG